MTHELAANGVTLVTVVVQGRQTAIEKVVADTGLDAPILLGTSELRDRWRLDVVPWTVIVDKDGKAREVLKGGQDGATFRKVIEKVL